MGVQYASSELEDASESDTYDFVYDVNTLRLFLEPKFVVLVFADRLGLYVSGRVAVSRMTEKEFGTRQEVDVNNQPIGPLEAYSANGTRTGIAAFLSPGLLVRLTPRVNLDLGVSWGTAYWGDLQTELQTSAPVSRTYGAWVGLVIGIG